MFRLVLLLLGFYQSALAVSLDGKITAISSRGVLIIEISDSIAVSTTKEISLKRAGQTVQGKLLKSQDNKILVKPLSSADLEIDDEIKIDFDPAIEIKPEEISEPLDNQDTEFNLAFSGAVHAYAVSTRAAPKERLIGVKPSFGGVLGYLTPVSNSLLLGFKTEFNQITFQSYTGKNFDKTTVNQWKLLVPMVYYFKPYLATSFEGGIERNLYIGDTDKDDIQVIEANIWTFYPSLYLKKSLSSKSRVVFNLGPIFSLQKKMEDFRALSNYGYNARISTVNNLGPIGLYISIYYRIMNEWNSIARQQQRSFIFYVGII